MRETVILLGTVALIAFAGAAAAPVLVRRAGLVCVIAMLAFSGGSAGPREWVSATPPDGWEPPPCAHTAPESDTSATCGFSYFELR
ncbi:hypothetical protein [Streptomyces apocyni]|uniref:hypothetical protein n=1 Tax=Streptomyces apocyni TaxID=2654677 RepID=UPI0012E9B141|nr:hypothetical protein [Streptomyces apocyni]